MRQFIGKLILGNDARTRVRLKRSLAAAAVGMVGLLIQLAAVAAGMTELFWANVLSVFAVISLSAVYVAQRSGWSRRFRDPAMTMGQMVLGILILVAVYAINPAIRGMTTLIMAMTLVFGAFILPPSRCRQLGWLAVASLAVAMGAMAGLRPWVFEPRIEAFHFLLAALVLPVIAAVAGQLSAIRDQHRVQNAELAAALKTLQLLATHDELTGLPNRRQILESFALEARQSERQRTRICCCLIDIDHFKHINDTLGHQSGDETLNLFARVLGERLRAADVLARWGGEEFLLLLPATSVEEAMVMVDRLRATCDDPKSWSGNEQLRVSFSAGIAEHLPAASCAMTIANADAALYLAKHSGRNCVKSHRASD